MFVLIAGSLEEGVQYVVGPFSTPDEAEVYGESHNMGHYGWLVSPVTEPKT
jgi:hypothetical protein